MKGTFKKRSTVISAILLTAIIMQFFALPVYSQNAPSKTVIYYFQNNTENEKYSYYSYIIADSISKHLSMELGKNASTIPTVARYLPATDPSVDESYYQELQALAEGAQCDYLVIGGYRVYENKIFITTSLYDPKSKKYFEVSESTEEISAIMTNLINNLTQKINTELAQNENRAKAEPIKVEPPKELALRPTGFYEFYSMLSGLYCTAGYEYFKFFGSWGNLYPNVDSFSLSAGYALHFINNYWLRNLGVGYQQLFLMTKHDGMNSKTPTSYFKIQTYEATISYKMPLIFSFTAMIRIGGGLTKSTLSFNSNTISNNNGPFGEKLINVVSNDPLVSAEFNISYNLNKIIIYTGIHYIRVFYLDEAMNLGGIAGGAGIIF